MNAKKKQKIKVSPSSGYHNEAEENENENLGDAIYHLPNQKKRERDWIIKEIVDTEWKYITNLKGKFHFQPFRSGINPYCQIMENLSRFFF